MDDKNSRFFTFVLVLLAIASQIWYLRGYSRLNPDEAFSLNQAISFSEGRGLTYQSALPDDFANIFTVYDPRFPPGVALSLFFFAEIFGTFGQADFALEVFATIVFFLSWYWILKQHKAIISTWAKGVILSLWIFFPAPLMAGTLTAHTTETLSLSFFIASIVLGALLINSSDAKKRLILALIIGVVSGLAASLRYMYWPMLAVLPASIFIFAFVKKKLSVFTSAVITIISVSALFLGGMMLMNYKSTDHFYGYETDLYGMPQTRLPEATAVHLDHIKRTIPFPLFTLGISNTSFMETRVALINVPPTFSFTRTTEWLLSGFILLAFGLYIWEILSPWYVDIIRRRRKKTQEDEKEQNGTLQFIALVGLVTVGLIIITLVYLSVTMELHPFGGGWVPVMELRYYSPTFVFLTLGIGYVLSQVKSKRTLIRYFSYLLNIISITSLFVVVFWRGQVEYRRLSFPESYFTGEERYEREMKLMTSLDAYLVSPYPVVVVYPQDDTNIRRKAFQRGYVVCPLGLIPPEKPLSTSEPVNVILMYRDTESKQVQEYFLSLTQQNDGVCLERGNFTGCHILFTPVESQ